MVNKEKINGNIYYQCDIFKFYYKEKSLAEKCRAWCDKNQSCNMEITKHAVNPEKDKKIIGGCC